jgi:hypothetical protein
MRRARETATALSRAVCNSRSTERAASLAFIDNVSVLKLGTSTAASVTIAAITMISSMRLKPRSLDTLAPCTGRPPAGVNRRKSYSMGRTVRNAEEM